MRARDLVRNYLQLPSGVALLLGLGAVSATGTGVATRDVEPGGGAAEAALGAVTVRAEGGKIYLQERGRETELQLGATAEREHLLQLLEPHGREGVTLDAGRRLIIAGGGGAGFSLRDVAKSLSGKPAAASKNAPAPTTRPNPPATQSEPRDRQPADNKRG